MNIAELEILCRVRRERLAEYAFKSGSKRTGLVSVGQASWLLNISRIRVYALVVLERLGERSVGGQLLIRVRDIFQFAIDGERRLAAAKKRETTTR